MVTPGIHRWAALLAGRLPRLRARDGHRRPLMRRLALIAGPMVLLVPLAASGPLSFSSARASAVGFPASAGPTVNWALAGQASASSSESGDPPANAIDGDAGTDWCTSSWT